MIIVHRTFFFYLFAELMPCVMKEKEPGYISALKTCLHAMGQSCVLLNIV